MASAQEVHMSDKQSKLKKEVEKTCIIEEPDRDLDRITKLIEDKAKFKPNQSDINDLFDYIERFSFTNESEFKRNLEILVSFVEEKTKRKLNKAAFDEFWGFRQESINFISKWSKTVGMSIVNSQEYKEIHVRATSTFRELGKFLREQNSDKMQAAETWKKYSANLNEYAHKLSGLLKKDLESMTILIL